MHPLTILIGFNSGYKANEHTIQHKARQSKTQARMKMLINSTNTCLNNKIIQKIAHKQESIEKTSETRTYTKKWLNADTHF